MSDKNKSNDKTYKGTDKSEGLCHSVDIASTKRYSRNPSGSSKSKSKPEIDKKE